MPAWIGRQRQQMRQRLLEERPRLGVWALSRITGENPVPDEAAGNVRKMSEAWLNWGRAF